MDNKTLEALNGSIEKWGKIVAEEGEDEGVKNCPLCATFYEGRNYGDECNGCPVALKTGRKFCIDSPYDKWCKVQEAHSMERFIVFNERSRELAQAELDFLKSLLPSEDKKEPPA